MPKTLGTFQAQLQDDLAKKLSQILKDEEMTFEEWLTNAVEDYDS